MIVRNILRSLLVGLACVALVGCSVFGKSGVEIAAYNVIESDGEIEVRFYKDLVLASTPMKGDNEGSDSAFQRLFDYISGANTTQSSIAMTAPVVTDSKPSEGQKIAMTAPVFMDQETSQESGTMSFVLPAELTLETAPKPTNPKVSVSKVEEMTVATIRFSGLLRRDNIAKNQEKLEQWINSRGYTVSGEPKSAGYNPPWTLPNMRRNEVLIPVSR